MFWSGNGRRWFPSGVCRSHHKQLMISFGHGNGGGGLISAMPLEDFIDENTGLAEIAHRSAPEKSNQSSGWVPVAVATWFCCLSILYSLFSILCPLSPLISDSCYHQRCRSFSSFCCFLFSSLSAA